MAMFLLLLLLRCDGCESPPIYAVGFEMNLDHHLDGISDESTKFSKDEALKNLQLEEERKVIVKTVHELYEFIDEKAIEEVCFLKERERERERESAREQSLSFKWAEIRLSFLFLVCVCNGHFFCLSLFSSISNFVNV
jgi:hypothetical protein